jgi:hypothetical protein
VAAAKKLAIGNGNIRGFMGWKIASDLMRGSAHSLLARRVDCRATSSISSAMLAAPHPDLTAAAEAGICRNAYVGQIGFLLLDGHPLAQAVVGRMATLADSAKRTRPYLDDDLRLCRWGILPVLTALLAGSPDPAETPAEFARCYAPGWTVHKIAGLAA